MWRIAALVTGVLAVLLALAMPSGAVTSTLLYDYSFNSSNVTGDSVANLASGTYAGVNLTLYAAVSGDWSFANSNQGVQFTGDTSTNQSVAYGLPPSGTDTIDVPNGMSLGEEAQITFQSPTDDLCSDTPNIAQIGRSDSGGQVKIQLSNCTAGDPTYGECRVAGSDSSPQNDTPVEDTKAALINGDQYNITCVKGIGNASGDATITITVDNVTASTSTSFMASRPVGNVVNPNQYISAGNKYPLPPLASNTDQFNGIEYTAAWCQATSVANSNSCLAAALVTIT